MWRRVTILLTCLRLYMALFPTYLHPDENFQGPEVIAGGRCCRNDYLCRNSVLMSGLGRIFSYKVHETWEFTVSRPIRSAFTLWPPYGFPMLVMKWLWEGSGHGLVKPATVFWTLRAIMFTLSFVLEDWAVYELVESARERNLATLLIASSYVTWTWQVHTFSNAIETLILLWSLVLIRRTIRNTSEPSSVWGPCVLSFLTVFGTFNRITFPAFLAVPGLQLLLSLRSRPSLFLVFAFWTSLFLMLAISVDTVFYHPKNTPILQLLRNIIIAPLNNLRYNSQPRNLALHGIHPVYQHILINLPQLLGPALPLVIFSARKTIRLASAFSGIAILSFFPHQEARFLLPTIPLLLSSVNIPKSLIKPFALAWITFNVILGSLMGVYHQGGVIPAQIWLETQESVSQVFWWKTYSPPRWLLNGRNHAVTTTDLMGLHSSKLVATICAHPTSVSGQSVLVAPVSAEFLDQFTMGANYFKQGPNLSLSEIWSYRKHINLDDLDIGEEGIWKTWSRVVGRRGLKAWRIECL